MRTRSTLIMTILLAFTALAGCSDAPPSGDLPSGASAILLNGDTRTEFQAEVRNAPEQAGPLQDALCAPDDTGTGECQDARTEIQVMLHEAPEPNNNGYTAYWVGGAEAPTDLEIGHLEPNGTMYDITKVFEGQNFDGHFSSVEVRMGPIVVASGPGNGGVIAVSPELENVAVTASYEGKTLTFDATGLPDNATFTGWLVGFPEDGEEGAEIEHLEEFEVVAGENEYTADRNIDEYDEFHIHLAGSKINIYKTTIE